jgi:NAD(P)-dependent dehydrogenase (short-subunit alcohol dehydrogenase family)
MFFKSQLLTSIPTPTDAFTGQTIIVTGASAGLGLEAARHLLRLDATLVILAVRNESKGQKAAQDLLKSTDREQASVQVWKVDLADYQSVVRFGERAKSLDRLDAVILNAGMLTHQFTRMSSGDEMTFGVNVVSNSLLGLLLLPKLRESAARTGSTGRLSFVGSDLIQVAKFNEQNSQHSSLFEAMNDERKADMSDR